VEDNELNQEIAEYILTELGIDVTLAVNGQEAVELFKNSAPGTFHIIFMDVMMPVMDGHEATREIRSLKRPDGTKIPIIAMTANAFAEDVKAAMDAGMNEHITKPLEPEIIDRVLRDWLTEEKQEK
jgi:CheY-like chemotaxis protein